MLVWIIKLLKDERGIAPLVIGGALAGGGALLGGILGKNKQKTIDPYAQLRGEYQNYLSGKLGTSTPYSYNEAFTIDQPGIEKQAEDVISSKLGNSPKLQSDIQDISNRYYEAQKKQMGDRFEEEQTAQKNMYNRLGLASSTPGLAASTNLGRKQENELGVLSADIANQGIDREMQAMKLAEDITNQYLTQGQTLGQTQRASQQYSQGMSMADIERMVNEEYNNASLSGNLLGSNHPQYYYEPNAWSQIGSGMQNIGTSLLMANILGGGGAAAGATGATGATGGTSPYIQNLLKQLSLGG